MPNTSNKKAAASNGKSSEMKTNDKSPSALKTNKEEAVTSRSKSSSSPMGGENNRSGNSANRQGDSSNSSGGSYKKSNKDM